MTLDENAGDLRSERHDGAAAAAAVTFENTYARLPERFFVRMKPTAVAAPRLLALNEALATALGIDPAVLRSEAGLALLAGNRIADGSTPIAQVYAGHQFGGFSPQLGDGRAMLLGEVVGRDGVRRDIQLKGSGPTPFARMGDGRATLGPMLREYLVSEAMAALGVPTTRSLAVVATGETVLRDRPLPGAVLTRVAASHVRVGTFQYFAARGDREAVRVLADYVIARHGLDGPVEGNPYRALLQTVIGRQAALVARWLLVGFVHGVMNTDNVAISGETIDYGPCAFIDAYDPAAVFSSIDAYGRYAFANQPQIMHWNMVRLAEALLPLLADEDEDEAVAAAQAALAVFAPAFRDAYHDGMRRKLGLATRREGDEALAEALLSAMAANGADMTLTFRALCDAAEDSAADATVRARFADGGAYDAWAAAWHARLQAEPLAPGERRQAMRAANPAVIPRNHLVEAALQAAVEDRDLGRFDALRAVLATPFVDPADTLLYGPPDAPDPSYRTFCGT